MADDKGNIFNRKKEEPKLIEEKKLDDLVSKSRRILYRTKTVFPFDLFPDEIIIDENKVDIIVKPFFYTENIFPVLLKNIHGVTINSSLFFASLSFEVIGMENDPGEIRFLWSNDAYKIKRIVTGLTIAIKEGLDLSKIPAEELVTKVEEIGKSRNAIALNEK
jgi:hypothetical protein